MADIKIVVDTSSDIPPEIAEKYDIGILSFLSIFGEESYVSGVDLTNREFYEKLASADAIPTTAQTPYTDMYDYLLEQSRIHDSVIFFTISSKGSGQYTTAQMVRNDILENDNPNADIHIVDSMKYSLYITAGAIYACALAKEGKTPEQIIPLCHEYMESWDVFLLVDTLKYLEKGGRINKAKAVVGTLLDLKPVLSIRDGLIENVDKLRGKKKLLEKLVEKIKEDPHFDTEKKQFMVVQSDDEKGRQMCELLKREFGIEDIFLYSEFGPIVGTHTGPGAVAVIYRTK